MRPKFWTYALTAAALFLSGGALAQGGLAAVADGDAVLLRWLLPDQEFPAGGFTLTRSGPDGTITLSVPSPAPRETAIAAGWVSAEEYDFLAELYRPGERVEGDDFLLGMMTLSSVGRPGYARAMGTLFEDAQVVAGEHYTYELSVGGSVLGVAGVLAGEASQPPPATGLHAGVEVDSIALRWFTPPEEDLIAAYFVYRAEEGAQEVVLHEGPHFPPDPDLEPGAAQYVDDTAEAGVQYTYRVQAMDLFGRLALFSAPVSAFIPDEDQIVAPMISGSEAQDGSITLSWRAPRDERIVGLALLRYEDLEAEPVLVTGSLLPADSSGHTDTDVTGGVTYYYALSAADAAGNMSPESAAWSELALNLTPPTPPATLAVEPGVSSLGLSWRASPESDILAYRVYVSRQADPQASDYRYIASVADTAYALEFEGESLNEFRFRVSAVNTSGVEGELSQPAGGRLIDVTPPPAPVMTRAEPGRNGISVHWAASSNPDVAALNLYRTGDGGERELLASGLDPAGLTHLDADAAPGVAYGYALSAVDASGNESELSAARIAMLPGASGGPPVARGFGAALVDAGVRLTWLAQPETLYVVERARGGGGFVQLNDPTEAGFFADATGLAGDRYRLIPLDAEGRVGTATQEVVAGE